jgi:hypothetical protein
MPAYTRTGRSTDLRLILFNSGDILDVQLAATPQEASRVAIMMLSSRDALNHGDTLTIRDADQDRLRSSHSAARSESSLSSCTDADAAKVKVRPALGRPGGPKRTVRRACS